MKIQQNDKMINGVRLKYIERMYEFKNSEDLAQCVVLIYKKENLRKITSSLYKMNDSYRLIIKSSRNCKSGVFAEEFCQKWSSSAIDISATKEYGKPLISRKAVAVFGRAFVKAPL